MSSSAIHEGQQLPGFGLGVCILQQACHTQKQLPPHTEIEVCKCKPANTTAGSLLSLAFVLMHAPFFTMKPATILHIEQHVDAAVKVHALRRIVQTVSPKLQPDGQGVKERSNGCKVMQGQPG